MKKIFITALLIFISLAYPVQAQFRGDARDTQDGVRQLSKIAAPIDRAQNVININRFGQVVTNMGQWHPYTGVFPRGRWPITTNHDQTYKMSFFVGIPYNVAHARGNGTKEWDPISGNHNPVTGKIAISTDKTTWPLNSSGQPFWPVRTLDGRDSIVSQQDTYCQYNDNTNARPEKLKIQVTQKSYAWSTSKDQDYIIWELEIFNNSDLPKDSLYFGIYYDFDAGGISNEYDNDYYVWDHNKQLTYVVGPTGTTSWEPGSKPFLLGLIFLETPMVDSRGWVVNQNGTRMGITDWHYGGVYTSAWGDNPTDDIVFFDWISSNERLRNNPTRPNLFHGPNRRIDDWRLQDTISGKMGDGDGVDGVASSGPYHMEPYQKMKFIFAHIAQESKSELYTVADRAKQIYENGLKLVPPPKPEINYTAYDNSVTLKWSNEKEFTHIDTRTGKSAIKEYRIYKTTDPNRENWGNPVAIVLRDSTKNSVVADLYQWTDNVDIKNYFYYSYAVTVYDVDGLESGKALLSADKSAEENVVEARPVSSPRNSLNQVRVVPNPYIISSTWERKRLGDPKLGEPIRDIAFTNLPARCTISIYTLDGNLVKSIEHSNGTGTEFWDLRTFSNQLIATGIYVYHIKSEAGEKVSKFAVVR